MDSGTAAAAGAAGSLNSKQRSSLLKYLKVEDEEHCVFTPKINAKSAKMDESRKDQLIKTLQGGKADEELGDEEEEEGICESANLSQKLNESNRTGVGAMMHQAMKAAKYCDEQQEEQQSS